MTLRIALDAMGSDAHPGPDVAGAVQAARRWGDTIVLVGDRARVSAALAGHDTAGLTLEIVDAPEAIGMDDSPTVAARQKPASSMHVGMNLVRDGAADAFVTAGNTGAALVVATLYTLKRIRGVRRPALGVRFPTPGFPLLIDGGANADCKPDYLQQFALMGSLYMQHVVGIERPRVGLISNGEEEGKGNELVRAAAELLAITPINYIGSVEPKEFMRGGVDVAVCDGFTGNIMLKTTEATARMLLTLLREEITAGTLTKLGGLLARPAFERVRAQLDPEAVGGAPLLGVNGVVIIGHGRSGPDAIESAIGQARRAVQSDVIGAIRAGLADLATPEAESTE